jgi:hydrogenase nickel incorporation protein HypB
VHPGVPSLLMSARTGEGVEAFRDWLAALPQRRMVEA